MGLLRERNVALVIADRPEIHGFQTHELTPTSLTSASTRVPGASAALLAVRVRRVGMSDPRLGSERRRVRVLNNDWEGFAIRTLSL